MKREERRLQFAPLKCHPVDRLLVVNVEPHLPPPITRHPPSLEIFRCSRIEFRLRPSCVKSF